MRPTQPNAHAHHTVLVALDGRAPSSHYQRNTTYHTPAATAAVSHRSTQYTRGTRSLLIRLDRQCWARVAQQQHCYQQQPFCTHPWTVKRRRLSAAPAPYRHHASTRVWQVPAQTHPGHKRQKRRFHEPPFSATAVFTYTCCIQQPLWVHHALKLKESTSIV